MEARFTLAEVEAEAEALKAELEPASPEEIVTAFKRYAARRALAWPEDFDMDFETYRGWPRQVFVEAFKAMWGNWPYPRVPNAGEMQRYAREPLAKHLAPYRALSDMAMKLRTRQILGHRF